MQPALEPSPRGVVIARQAFVSLALIVPLLACLLLPPSLGRNLAGRNEMKCRNNLRQLALAALQYSDDRGGRSPTSPGGVDTNASARTSRTLLNLGYLDDPEAFICPSSVDVHFPPDGGPLSTWTWDAPGAGRAPDGGPDPDPTLEETTELSYGWYHLERLDAPAAEPLVADRAQAPADWEEAVGALTGNHQSGFNVAFSDASVQKIWTPALPPASAPYTYLDVAANGLLRDPPAPPLRARLPSTEVLAELAGLAWLVALVSTGYCGWLRPAARPVRRAARLRPRARPRWLTALVDGVGPAPLGAARSTPEGKPRVVLSPGQRCPYCHDGVGPEDDLVACRVCRTLLHRECARENGTCSSLGCHGRQGGAAR